MATLASIENNTWSISTIGYGVIVEGIAVLRQRIDLALRTTKRSDPLRPEFGSDIYKYIDAPHKIAIPNIKAEIISALELWVPEVTIISVKHSFNNEYNPVFEITYQPVDDSIIDNIIFDLRSGQTTSTAITEIILQAFFPPNPNSYRYQVSLIRNDVAATPSPNPGGYANIQEMFDWIMANWYFRGRWFLLSDRIVCYMSSEGVTNASLSIAVIALVRVTAEFPALDPSMNYKVAFTVNGQPATPAMPETFGLPGEVLFWAQNNWGSYGSWSIEGVSSNQSVPFSDDFSGDFDSPLPDTFKLVLLSSIANFTGELQITSI